MYSQTSDAERLNCEDQYSFLTSINLGHQKLSQIQSNNLGAVRATRLLEDLLRRRLSLLRGRNDLSCLTDLMDQLLVPEDIDTWLHEALFEYLQDRKKLRYRFDPGLLGEVANPQAKYLKP
mgnify:CR=1 FL=1